MAVFGHGKNLILEGSMYARVGDYTGRLSKQNYLLKKYLRQRLCIQTSLQPQGCITSWCVAGERVREKKVLRS